MRVSVHVLPGFVGFFSNIPGPCDEILAQIRHYGLCAHHLGAKDIAENTVVVVEVDRKQLSLRNRKKKNRTIEISLL